MFKKSKNTVAEDRNTLAVKAALWYTISNIAVQAVSLLTTPIYTRIMGTGDYGMASTFQSWRSLLFIICTLNMSYTIGRAKIDFEGELDKYIGSLQTFSAIIILAFSGIALFFSEQIAGFLQLDEVLVWVLLIYLMSNVAVSFSQSKYRFQYRYKENIAITVFTTIATFVFTIILIPVFKENKYYGKILGSVIPVAILGIAIWIRNIQKKRICISKRYWKYALTLSLPLIGHTVSLYILSQSDRLLITRYCGADYTGIYSIAYTYATLISLVTDSVNNAYNPWFHDTYYEKKYSDIWNAVKPMVSLGCYIGVGCIAIAPEAIYLLGGEPYADGRWIVLPVAIGVIVQYVYSHYVIIEMHLKKTVYVAVGTSIAAVTNIVLNIIFIPRYGYIAAGYTTLFSYIILLLCHFVVTRFILKIHLYKDKYMFGSIAALGLVACLMGFLYSTIVPRYVLLVVISIGYLATNWKYLIEIKDRFLHK